MPDIMRTVLLLSLCGTALAVLLAVLRRLLKNRLPKALFYYLWLLVLLRLALPVALPVPGLELTLPEPRSAEAVTPPVSVQAAPDGMVGQPIPFDPSYVQTVPADTVITGNGLELSFQQEKTLWYRSVWTFLCENFLHIWLAGAAIHFLWFAVSYFRFCRSLKQDCLPLWEHEQALLEGLRGKWRVEACRSPLAQTPMLVGLIRPRIILPETAITTLQLECILRHELTHLRRRDLLYKWFTVAVTSFHWFNPFMPWLRREIDRCCELSCDEGVIRTMTEGQRQAYGETLLALAAVHALPRTVPATTLCEEKAQLKERLVGIMKHKKVTAAILLLSCLLALLVAGCAAVLGPNAARRELPQAADYDLWIQADQKETFVRNWKAEYHDGTEVASVHFAPKDHSGDDYVFRGRDLPALRARVEAWAFAELPLDRDNCILYYQMEPELLLAASSQITVFPLDGGEPARMELSQLDMSTYCGHVTVTDLGDNGVWLVVLTDGDRAAQAQPTEPADPNQIAVLDLTGRVAVLIENAPLDNAFAETVDAEGRTVVMDMALTLRKGDLVYVESQEGGACAVTVLAGEPPRARGTLDVRLLSVEQTELENANQVILKNAPQWVGPNEGLFAGAAVSGVANVEKRKDNWYCVTLPGGDNAFWVRREDIVFDAYILPWNDPEDSRKRFGEILWNAYLKGELPDGSKLDWTSSKDAAENHFAVTDIDGDGKEELLLSWTNASMAGHSFVIFGCRQGAVYTQFSGFPSLRFYDNAAIEEDWSHNQGWSGRFWPHYAYRYNPQSDLYEQVGFVEGWDKQVVSEGFPDDIDADGDGLVYDVRSADADWTIGSRYEPERMMDGPAYEEWRQSYLNGSQEVEIGLIPLTEENIAALGAPKPIAPEVKPVG
ncbi:MAG: M56 family metallopeptidase [Clostridia bacterium]|nr:M56 family metallopeptidase [Clostridia bacterium]